MFEALQISLPVLGFTELADDAEAEGHEFLHRMNAEWDDGRNQFHLPGEFVLGVFEGRRLIAVGGLNQCPYSNDQRVGRLRHLFVSSNSRNRGIASRLIRKIIYSASESSNIVRLRTSNPAAIALYEKYGFSRSNHPLATHEIKV